jgi:hypothetical protein
LQIALETAGHTVRRGVDRPVRRADEIAVDYARDIDPDAWRGRLTGVDAVINTVGILREGRGRRFDANHHQVPRALFAACREAGVRRVIQVSALGADAGAASRFHRSKRAADDFLAHAKPRMGHRAAGLLRREPSAYPFGRTCVPHVPRLSVRAPRGHGPRAGAGARRAGRPNAGVGLDGRARARRSVDPRKPRDAGARQHGGRGDDEDLAGPGAASHSSRHGRRCCSPARRGWVGSRPVKPPLGKHKGASEAVRRPWQGTAMNEVFLVHLS